MNEDMLEKATNALFLNLTLKLGEIYLEKGASYALDIAHKESRWKWVDENFLKEAALFYSFAISSKAKNIDLPSYSLESLLEFANDSKSRKPQKGSILGNYLKNYLGYN